MKLYVTMMDNETKETRTVETDVHSTIEDTLYDLLEGDKSCDCCRDCDFNPTNSEDWSCGEEKYSIIDIKIGVDFVDRDFYNETTQKFLEDLVARSKHNDWYA